MTKDEARKELLETLEEYCHDRGYGLQVFAGLSDLVYTLYPLQKTMTNADKIRSMSDEKLAAWLWNHIDNDVFCGDMCADEQARIWCGESPSVEKCADKMLEWLKQEHKEA